MATPASLNDVVLVAKKDPVAFYVGLAVAAAQPPARAIVVPLVGRRLVLPDWSGDEWAWYGDTANRFAANVEAGNPRAGEDMATQVGLLAPRLEAMRALGAQRPAPADAAAFYDRSVRVVIASANAATAETRGKLAFEAFSEAIPEAPAAILTAIKSTLTGGLANMTKIQREASKILGQIFSEPFKAVAGGLLAGLGPTGILLIAGGLYLLYGRK